MPVQHDPRTGKFMGGSRGARLAKAPAIAAKTGQRVSKVRSELKNQMKPALRDMSLLAKHKPVIHRRQRH